MVRTLKALNFCCIYHGKIRASCAVLNHIVQQQVQRYDDDPDRVDLAGLDSQHGVYIVLHSCSSCNKPCVI